MNYTAARQLPPATIRALVNRSFIQGVQPKCRECICDCERRWWKFDDEKHAPECRNGALIDAVLGRAQMRLL